MEFPICATLITTFFFEDVLVYSKHCFDKTISHLEGEGNHHAKVVDPAALRDSKQLRM